MPLKIIQQGAEAVIKQDEGEIIKERTSKSYRIRELDDKIIKQRTKAEKKLLEKACKIIDAPNPFPLKEFNVIKMTFIKGKKLSKYLAEFPLTKQKQICRQMGKDIARLHNENIIHGDLTTSNMILVENNNRLKKDKFDQQLSELKKLNLPRGRFAIFGSGPLGIKRLRECRDIDVIVDENLWQEYKNKSGWKYQITENGVEHLSKGIIEFWHNWLPWYSNIDKFIKDAEIIKGFPFVKLKYVLVWKKKFGREKDLKDVKLIEEYKKRGYNSSQKIFFIDFGLGFISRKFEDKAVDLHLLKQALEAKHFEHWEELFNEVVKGYKISSSSETRKIVLERLKAVEKRGRYKH